MVHTARRSIIAHLLLTFYSKALIFLQGVYRRGILAPDQNNLLQGTLDMMILKALALGELHGLGVSRRIEQITQGTFQVKPARSSRLCIAWKNEAGWSPVGAS